MYYIEFFRTTAITVHSVSISLWLIFLFNFYEQLWQYNNMYVHCVRTIQNQNQKKWNSEIFQCQLQKQEQGKRERELVPKSTKIQQLLCFSWVVQPIRLDSFAICLPFSSECYTFICAAIVLNSYFFFLFIHSFHRSFLLLCSLALCMNIIKLIKKKMEQREWMREKNEDAMCLL